MYVYDTDNDGLSNYFERQLGTDRSNPDTDGDGLPDGYEVITLGTNPLIPDTDDNGILDGDEDFDGDILCNLDEFTLNTDPWSSDTDGDGLNDGEEVNMYGTDPLNPDTDGDSLYDGDELILGLDPANPITDGITHDSERRFDQTYIHIVENDECAVSEVSVSLNGTGFIDRTMTVDSVMEVDIMSTNVVGLIGEPFDITTTSKFDEAVLSFKVDENKIADALLDDLIFLWYDEENHFYEMLETKYDYVNSTVSTTVNHFSTYMLVNKNNWFEAWNREIKYGEVKDYDYRNQSVVLAIDCSGSMLTNDPQFTISETVETAPGTLVSVPRKVYNRTLAAEGYIETMRANDKTAIVTFESTAKVISELTRDKSGLKSSLSGLYSSGGTSFSVALRKSIDILKADISGFERTIILMSDGEDSTNLTSLLTEAKNNNIKIHTICLSKSSSYDKYLKNISDATGGQFYKVYTSAELVDLYKEIGEEIGVDLRDTDGDGLADVYEIAGMRLINGQIIYTDPYNDDTDGDGLKDGEEILPELKYCEMNMTNMTSGVPEIRTTKGYYFEMKSDPNNEDSDGDGLLDGKAIEHNENKIAPKDPNLLKKDGVKDTWKQHIIRNKLYDIPTYLTDDFFSYGDFWGDIGAYWLGFKVDMDNVHHAKVDTWQKNWGYNGGYDFTFMVGTLNNMSKEKVYLYDTNDVEYAIWMWKGYYLNLQTGAEIGVYSDPNIVGHWNASKISFPMTLDLYDISKNATQAVFCWNPSDPQWWITGFNTYYKYPGKENLAIVASIDFIGHEDMYESFKDGYQVNSPLSSNFIFDEDGHTVWINW